MSALTKEAAAQLLFEQVHVPVFTDRLRQHGIVPRNEVELGIMLKGAAELHDREIAEQAVPTVDPMLQKFAAALSVPTEQQQQIQQTQVITDMAKRAAANPTLAAAIQVLTT